MSSAANSPSHPCPRCGHPLPSGEAEVCAHCLAADLVGEEFEETEPNSIEAAGFELLEQLGTGGMGVVYRAHQRAAHRDVALKMLLPHLASSEDNRRRLLTEAEAMAELNHSHILPLFAAGECDGRPWLAMQLIEGGPLSSFIADYSRQWRKIAALVSSLADAIAHAHSRGVIHRDLKPGNVLFDNAGKAYIADFGLAKWVEADQAFTQTQSIMGTLVYMAPEVAKGGGRAATTASDTYGLGAILYELITGRAPFRGASTQELLRKVMEDDPAVPSTVQPGVPRDLEIICAKAMAKQPAARYDSALRMREDLEAWLRGDPITARPVTITARVVRLAKRYPLTSSLAVALGLTLAIGSVLLVRKNQDLETALKRRGIARDAAEDRVTFMVNELPRHLAPVGRLGVLAPVFENLDAYYRHTAGELLDEGERRGQFTREAAFYAQWAAVLQDLGRPEEMMDRMEAACRAAESAAGIPGAPADAWAMRASTLRRRAELEMFTGRHDAADASLAACADVLRQAEAVHPGQAALRVEKAELLSEQGYLHLENRDAAAASAPLRQAAQLWRELAAPAEPGLAPDQHQRAGFMAVRSLYELARLAGLERNREAEKAADEAHHRAAEAWAAADPPDHARQLELAVACNRLSLSLRGGDDQERTRSEALAAQAGAILSRLSGTDQANIEWGINWAAMAMDTCSRERNRQPVNHDTVLKACEEVLGRLPVNVESHPLCLRLRGETRLVMADTFRQTGRNEDALEHTRLGLTDYLSAIRREPAHEAAHQALLSLVDHPVMTIWRAAGSPEAAAARALEWEQRLAALPAQNTVGTLLTGRTRAAFLRRAADTLGGISGRQEDAAQANLSAFELRAAACACPRLPGRILHDTGSAGGKLLDAPPAGFDGGRVFSALTAAAPHAARSEPSGSWRGDWAELCLRALRFIPEAERPAAARRAAQAFFSAPAAAPQNPDEQESLAQLKRHFDR